MSHPIDVPPQGCPTLGRDPTAPHADAWGCSQCRAQPPTLPCRVPQVWSHYEETPVEEVVPVLEEKERTTNYKPVFVTEITDDLHFYVQDVETGTGHPQHPQSGHGGASRVDEDL